MKIIPAPEPTVGLYDVAPGHGFRLDGDYYIRVDMSPVCEADPLLGQIVFACNLESGIVCTLNTYTPVHRAEMEVIVRPCESS